MKTKKLEKLLLLEQTGELSLRQRRKLNACPDAQTMRDELNALCASVPMVDVQPSPWAVTKIDARLRTGHRPLIVFSNHWNTALALAASLTAVAGILNFHGKPVASAVTTVAAAGAADELWDDPLTDDLVELESLIVALSDTSLDIMEL